MNILKVSNKSNPKAVAGALTASLRNDGKVHMQAIGAASVNPVSYTHLDVYKRQVYTLVFRQFV